VGASGRWKSGPTAAQALSKHALTATDKFLNDDDMVFTN
jgi:hypothetical protein